MSTEKQPGTNTEKIPPDLQPSEADYSDEPTWKTVWKRGDPATEMGLRLGILTDADIVD